MRALIRAFKKANHTENNAVYVFLVNLPCSDASLMGFMPFSKQFGFVFVPTTGTDAATLSRTIAHEVAHGTFNLRHTFSPENPYNLPQGITDNLMDYPSTSSGQATALFKYQWDLIHNPQRVWFSWLQEEGEGEMGLPCVGWFDDCKNVLQILETIRTARLNGKNIKIKALSDTSEKVLVANFVKIGDTDFKKIRLIYKSNGKDLSIDPLHYEYYDKVFMDSQGSDIQYGFVYYDEKMNEVLKILNDETEKLESLKDYLYGTGITFDVLCNGNKIKEETYVLISSTPQMPKIEIKNTSELDIQFRLRIEYKRDIRNDVDYFPGKEWETVKPGKIWNVDFEHKIRGGKATLLYKVGDKEYSFVFYIRGTNPTEEEVKSFIMQQGYNIWFLTRLIRQESGFHQFNPGNKYGPGWDDYVGCPNHGDPHGWGLMQLDVLNAKLGDHQVLGYWRPSAQALWDWKENIRIGVAFLQGEKYEMVNNHFNRELDILEKWNLRNPDDVVEKHLNRTEGNITYEHANSANFSIDFGGNPSSDNKSFIDATWIKNYNGSTRPGSNDGYYYNLEIENSSGKPYWEIYPLNKNNHNYVEAVSNQSP